MRSFLFGRLPARRLISALVAALAVTALAVVAPGLIARADPPPFVFVNDTLPAKLGADAKFRYQFTTSGDPATYALYQGELPVGLTISDRGVLSGRPIEAGSFTFTVVARHDEGGITVSTFSASHTVTVDPIGQLRLKRLGGDGGTAYTNRSFPGLLAVRVVDKKGHGVRGVEVVFTVPSAKTFVFLRGLDPDTSSVISGAGGLALEGAYALNTPGSTRVTATLTATGATVGFTLTVKPVPVPSSDLKVDLATARSVKSGGPLTVRVVVNNLGPTSAYGVTTTLTIPAGWTVVDPSGAVQTDQTLTWQAEPVDSDIPLTYPVLLRAATTVGTANLQATVAATTPDPSATNNADTAPVTVKG